MKRTSDKKEPSLSAQRITRMEKIDPIKRGFQYEGDSKHVVSTGSTLLDLAISGGRFKEGGLPMGILVEIFGPSGSGKTVLLCQIAGNLQKKDGDIMFHDPEARLNKQFAKMFGLDSESIDYQISDTVTDVFSSVRAWDVDPKKMNGVFADSLAALSTDLEMDNEDGDKMGMRRAKEFSQELRRTCRDITKNNLLMVCSNQIRQKHGATKYEQQYISPGGESIGFYSSLRLRAMSPRKIKTVKKLHGKEHEKVVGVFTEFEVAKSSIWEPLHTAPVYIIYDYGIDDIRGNITYLKAYSGNKGYELNGLYLGRSIDKAIATVEAGNLEQELKDAVILLWNEIEAKFDTDRKPKNQE